MSELRMASTRPSWMTQHRPKQASAVIRSSPPRSLPDPKRVCWSQAADPESPTTAMTQAVPQAGEPKTSILDELLGAAAPTSAPTVALASLAGVAESGPQASVPKLASTSAGSAESGAQAAAPAAATPVTPKHAAKSEPIQLPQTSPQEDPKEVLKLIESEVDLMGQECPRSQGFLEHLTEQWLTTEGLDLSGMHEMEDVRRALVKKIQDLITEQEHQQAAASVPGASAAPAAAAVQEPKGEQRKLPQDPDKFFKQIMRPKLQAGEPLDLAESLADWVPVHLTQCTEATYDALREDVKTIFAAYDSLSIYCLASYRPKEGVRLMLKVKGPDGKISQAGSHAFPLPETGLCPKHAHLYLDMLHLLARACQHEKADLGQVRAWHDEVKMHMDFILDEGCFC